MFTFVNSFKYLKAIFYKQKYEYCIYKFYYEHISLLKCVFYLAFKSHGLNGFKNSFSFVPRRRCGSVNY